MCVNHFKRIPKVPFCDLEVVSLKARKLPFEEVVLVCLPIPRVSEGLCGQVINIMCATSETKQQIRGRDLENNGPC